MERGFSAEFKGTFISVSHAFSFPRLSLTVALSVALTPATLPPI